MNIIRCFFYYNILIGMGDCFFEIKNNSTFLKVKVTTKSSKNSIVGIRNNELSVTVTSVPENGKANEAVIKLLSKNFKCAKTKINLISGEKCRNKIFRIDEVLDFSSLIQEEEIKGEAS